jgi:hypothetical protein
MSQDALPRHRGDTRLQRPQRTNRRQPVGAVQLSKSPVLRELLLEYFEDPEGVSPYAGDIGMHTDGINWKQSPSQVWAQIMREADKQDKLDALIARLGHVYPKLLTDLGKQQLTFSRTVERPIQGRDHLNAPSTQLARAESQEWRSVEAEEAITVFDQLRTSIDRVMALAETYQRVVKRRSEFWQFISHIERMSTANFASGDVYRLQSQRAAATEFGNLDDHLHLKVAEQVAILRDRASQYASLLTATRPLINELRERTVQGADVYLRATSLDPFWAQALEELYREIRDECTRMLHRVGATHQINLFSR